MDRRLLIAMVCWGAALSASGDPPPSGYPPVLVALPAPQPLAVDGRCDEWAEPALELSSPAGTARVFLGWNHRGLVLGLRLPAHATDRAAWGAISGGPRVRLICGGREESGVAPPPRPGRRSITVVDTGAVRTSAYRLMAPVGEDVGALPGAAVAKWDAAGFDLEAVIAWEAAASAPTPGRWSRLRLEIQRSPGDVAPTWVWPSATAGPDTGHLLVADRLRFWAWPQRYAIEHGEPVPLDASCSGDGVPLEVAAVPATTEEGEPPLRPDRRRLDTGSAKLAAGSQVVSAATDPLPPGSYFLLATAGEGEDAVASVPAPLLVREREQLPALAAGQAQAIPWWAVMAGVPTRVLIRWSVDAPGLPTGAQVELHAPAGWTSAQVANREASGFVSAWTTDANRLAPTPSPGACFVTRAPVAAGEVVQFVYGDSPQGALTPQKATEPGAVPGAFSLTVRIGSAAERTVAGEGLGLPVQPGSPAVLNVRAPTQAKAGRPFSLDLTVADRFGNRLTSYTGSVSLSAVGPEGQSVAAELPASARWLPDSRGHLSLESAVRFDRPGRFRIRAWAPRAALRGESDEIEVR